MRTVIAVACCVALAACASKGTPRSVYEYIDKVLESVPAQANPSKVVATEIAFARAARERGQWTAFAEYAAPGAVLHGQRGVIEAAPWLAQQKNPPVPVQWTPTAVWSSCDGKMAVSHGKFADPDGKWGLYVTAWELRPDNEYRYVYDSGAPDAELTAAETRKRPTAPVEGNVIVVEAFDAIRARVADCMPEAQVPARRMPILADGVQSKSFLSADKTFAWRWEHHPDNSRRLVVEMVENGAWTEPLVFAITPDNTIVR